MTLPEQIAARSRYHSLIAQAMELRDPSRRSGPSMWEAEEAARSMEIEAEAISSALYWAVSAEARRVWGMGESISHSTEIESETLCACAGVEME